MIFLDENKIKEDYDRFMSLIEEDPRSENLKRISSVTFEILSFYISIYRDTRYISGDTSVVGMLRLIS